MGNIRLETAREMLRLSAQVQLLFDGETLAALSPEAQRLLPGLPETATAGDVFAGNLEQYRRFRDEGSLLFSGDLAGRLYDITVTNLGTYRLVTAVPAERVQDEAMLLALAEQLRHPLASMMAVSPELFSRLEDGADRKTRERMAELNQSFYQLLRMVSNLERYAGLGPLHLARVELGNWLTQLALELTPLLEETGQVLELRATSERCYCDIDDAQLQQAVLALVSNGVKYSEQGGTITLSLQRSGDQLRISVQDRGEGIPADQMGLIFQRSAHRGSIPDPRWGIGLGLGVARSIVEAHGGRIMLESQVGKGTTVYIALNARKNMHDGELQSPVLLPADSYSPLLVALADVLPARVFDPRGVD